MSLDDDYALARRPFLEAPGPTPADKLVLRSWRYVLEINSACNLQCILCASGNRHQGYQYEPGIMDMDLLKRILDKAAQESPGAVVCCYVNSEPFLHPCIDECVAHIKMRGFRCELSSNFNVFRKVEETLTQRPDLFTVSVSGYTQATYARHHVGGDIEIVKENLVKLAEVSERLGNPSHIGVSFHMYKDNLSEVEPMRIFTEGLGFQFLLSWARTIVMEPTLQCLRELDRQQGREVLPYDHGPGELDLNTMLPPADPKFIASMDLLQCPPCRARDLYARWPVAPVCAIADVFTEVRHDGRVQLCAWTDDMRLTLGNYLEMSQDQISAARRGHPLCKECLKYRTNLYYHIVDPTKFDNGGYP